MSQLNGVMMQYFHWYIPADGSLWNQFRDQARHLAALGVTAVWLPPAYKGNSGAQDVGYSVYDMYDLGEFDQKGSVRTKYGTREELLAAVLRAKDAGIQIYHDIVFNHRMGGDEEEEFMATPFNPDDRHHPLDAPRPIKSWTKFTFPGRAGKYSAFQWNHHLFKAVDYDSQNPGYEAVYLVEGKSFATAVDMEKGSFDYLMGCDVEVEHPDVQDELKRWGEWYLDTVGMDGVRFDAVKHIQAGFFPDWLNHVRQYSGKRIFAVGEYWSFELEALRHFISITRGDVALFDAPLLMNFYQAAKSGADFDLTKIFEGSLVSLAPELAVTLVTNHDTQPLQALEAEIEAWFKPLAYALILLRRDGYPCIFHADYYGAQYKDNGQDGGEYEITMISHRFLLDHFLTTRREHAYGDQYDYFDHPNTIGWTRTGDEAHPGSLAVLMSNGTEGTKQMQTTRANTTYRDVTGHLEDTVTTDESGWGEFRCLGGSVSVWVPA